MRIGLRHIFVKIQIAGGHRRAVRSGVERQAEQLVENLCAQLTAALQSSLLVERVEKPRSLIDLSVSDQQPRDGRKLIGGPFHAARGASLFEAGGEGRRGLLTLRSKAKPRQGKRDRPSSVGP